MKKRRLISLVLCLSLILTSVITPTTVGFAAEKSVQVTWNDEAIYEITLEETQKEVLTAKTSGMLGGDYQWQILLDVKNDIWVDIYDCTQKECEISYALVKNMLDDAGSTYVRCAVNKGEDAIYSEKVCVTVKRAEAENPLVTSYAQTRYVGTENNSEAERPAVYRRTRAAEEPEFITITVKYLDIASLGEGAEESAIYSPYTARIERGTAFSQNVVSPTFIGFAPYMDSNNDRVIDDSDTDASSLLLNYTADQTMDDIVLYVYYRPIEVDFAVKYFFQNINDDLYTEDPARYHQGKAETGTIVTNEYLQQQAGVTEGFTKMYHIPESVAADGSTVFECYYDRNYFLIQFDLDGGYGIDPIYARYGTPFVVNDPVRPGYVFKGWQLVDIDADGNGRPDGEPLENPPSGLVSTVPACSYYYKAIWETEETTFTVVYWKENADDNNYTYWGSRNIENVKSASVVNGSDSTYRTWSELKDSQYFTYSHADENVVVEGDGTTVVNVYYSRNVYTLKFDISSYKNTFDMEGTHTHGDGNCDGVVCNAHIHNDSCSYTLKCGYEEHAEHTDACYGDCTVPEHKHSEVCCRIEPHTHSTACYSFSINGLEWGNAYDGNITNNGWGTSIANNGVARVYDWNSRGYKYYYKIGSTWYQVKGLTEQNYNRVSVSLTCSKAEHAHGTNCQYCSLSLEEHTHGEDCSATCGKSIHTHTKACKNYTCGFEDHKHTDSCSGKCSKVENYVTSENNKTYYVIKAKYEQTIGLQWPTAAYFDKKFYGWKIENYGTDQVSKLVNVVPVLCDTTDNEKIITVITKDNLSGAHIRYMFESFDQTSPENGVLRKLYDGVYYDLSSVYYQEVNLTANSGFGAKTILGMDAATEDGVKETIDGERHFFIYYDRKTYSLQFYNSTGYVKYNNNTGKWDTNLSAAASKISVKYEQPLSSFGTLPNPPYPDTFEENAYEFAGWYTTPECYTGSEVVWNTLKAPAQDLMLYAKWVPVVHEVNFFTSYDEMRAYETNGNAATYYKKDVPHGNILGTVETPTRTDESNLELVFAGWFYMENGEKKAYSSLNMPINRDMKIFAEWSSHSPQPYKITYVKKANPNEKVAEDSTGYAYGGSTKTFTAKAGAPYNQLYPEYNSGWFPTVGSHSITIQVETDIDNLEHNFFEFEYVQAERISYTVRYINKKTGAVMDSVQKETLESVVTERFKAYADMVPDAFYKRLVLEVELDEETGKYVGTENNVLDFYYTPNDTSAYYAVHFMLEKLDATDDQKNNYDIHGNGGYEESGTHIEGIGEVGTTVYLNAQDMTGFELKTNPDRVYTVYPKANGEEGTPTRIDKASNGYPLEVRSAGSELYFFYARKEYPYVVNYYHYNTTTPVDAENFPSEHGSAKYESIVTENAAVIPGYTCVSADTQSLKIAADDENKGINVINFYYSPIQYIAEYRVVTEDRGVLSESEDGGRLSNTIEVITGADVPKGSTPTAKPSYEFVGWYLDAECKKAVTEEGAVDPGTKKFTPSKEKMDDKNSNIYYAKFRRLYGDLTITRDDDAKDDQVYVYKIQDKNTGEVYYVTIDGDTDGGEKSVTIHDLPLGDYTVTQQNGWTWRYDDLSQDVTVDPDGETVDFEQGWLKQWLNGNSPLVKNRKGGE